MSHNNPSDISDKNVWIFDLDNTLYSADSHFFPQMDVRMGGFIADLLGVEYDEAKVIQKGYFVKYGTTLSGLMANHGVEPESFLDYVHDVDLAPILPAPNLCEQISKLNGRKLVFTNGSRGHGERLLKHLNMEHMFDGIFGVGQSGYVPKPEQKAYDSFVEHFDVDTTKAVMIDDMARNLTPAHKMGIKTVWLQTDSPWADIDYSEQHVDHEINCLEAWLNSVLGEKA
ncbi:MAG: pyrimidine 5'-nucleotidase [Sphingomonadales bacterium]|nr:pyrimidine 5'-nucleotidase [Sphingomonadales bacterium]